MHRQIEGALERHILHLVTARHPNEAVGLILPDNRVVELTNRSATPSNQFLITGRETHAAITQHGFLVNEDTVRRTTLWHSHPSGGVGPSRIDMQQKVPLMSHLVITVQVRGNTPTWIHTWY